MSYSLDVPQDFLGAVLRHCGSQFFSFVTEEHSAVISFENRWEYDEAKTFLADLEQKLVSAEITTGYVT